MVNRLRYSAELGFSSKYSTSFQCPKLLQLGLKVLSHLFPTVFVKYDPNKDGYANGLPVLVHQQAQKFKYLEVYLSYNLKWSGHISFVFTKVRKLSFYVRRLRSFSTPQFLIDRFVLLYSSPYPLLLSRSILWSLIKRLET